MPVKKIGRFYRIKRSKGKGYYPKKYKSKKAAKRRSAQMHMFKSIKRRSR